jgi:hypothetical protein
MGKWFGRALVLAILGYAIFWLYGTSRAGYFSLPSLPSGAYVLSFGNGLRAIVLDADVPDHSGDDAPRFFRALNVANPERKYLGVPLEVQPWFEDAWSWCTAPTEDDFANLEATPEEFRQKIENARFEAVCRIDVDGTEILRGLVFSVPNL